MENASLHNPRSADLAIRGVHGLVGRLPQRAALALGAAIGSAYARLGGPRVGDARINLEIAFPSWSAAQRERVLVASFANLGRGIAEVCQLAGPYDAALHRKIRIEGLEHLEAARAAGKQGEALLVSAHIGTWELCATALARRGVPVSVVGHERDQPALDALVANWREASGVETLRLGEAARGIFKALGRGRCVGVLMDQNASHSDGVFAPFFGLEACTRSGPMRLAMGRGVPILPVFITRAGSSHEHVMRFGPPFEVEPAGDDPDAALIRNVSRMNAAIEQAIRDAPEQWIWLHRRWKTRPPGADDSPYPRQRSWFRSLRKKLRARG